MDAVAMDALQSDDQLEEMAENAHRAQIQGALNEVHTSMPGIVQSFDPTTQTAVVQPAIQRLIVGVGAVNLPPCLDVPVYFPAGGDFVMTLPVRQGDECKLHFSERAIDFWFANGGVQLPSEYRLHDLSDAFAYVGFSSKPRALSNVATDAIEIRTRDGTTVLRVENGTVYVGGKAGSVKAIMGEPYRTAQQALDSTLLTAFTPLLTAIATLAGNPGELTAFAVTYPSIAGFIGALATFMGAWGPALQTFESGAATFLAQKAKVL